MTHPAPDHPAQDLANLFSALQSNGRQAGGTANGAHDYREVALTALRLFQEQSRVIANLTQTLLHERAIGARVDSAELAEREAELTEAHEVLLNIAQLVGISDQPTTSFHARLVQGVRELVASATAYHARAPGEFA